MTEQLLESGRWDQNIHGTCQTGQMFIVQRNQFATVVCSQGSVDGIGATQAMSGGDFASFVSDPLIERNPPDEMKCPESPDSLSHGWGVFTRSGEGGRDFHPKNGWNYDRSFARHDAINRRFSRREYFPVSC